MSETPEERALQAALSMHDDARHYVVILHHIEAAVTEAAEADTQRWRQEIIDVRAVLAAYPESDIFARTIAAIDDALDMEVK